MRIIPEDPNYLFVNKIRSDFYEIPLMHILKLERYFDKNFNILEISTKDGRFCKIAFSNQTQHNFNIFTILHSNTFPQTIPSRFPFKHSYQSPVNGWEIYSTHSDMTRLNLLGDFSMWRILDNTDYCYCDTYPPFLVVPRDLNPLEIRACAAFRSKNRFPVLVWGQSGTLWRSSQPRTGIRVQRCDEDEKYLRVLASASPSCEKLHIYDARGYMTAHAQRAIGGGVELSNNYDNIELNFLRISNVHSIREAWQAMLQSPNAPPTKYLSAVDKSGWLDLLSLILEGSVSVVSSLKRGFSVLVHCTDGWDRTSQLCSLAQICLDPHYRSIQGFCQLIQKDWVSFGHQFDVRLGHANPNLSNDKRSPIFIQFLDCVRQILLQFPTKLEFNDKLLYDLAYFAYSCRFGTFMGNSMKHRESEGIIQNTPSVWSYILDNAENYHNPFFVDEEPVILEPVSSVKKMQIWNEFFSRWHPDFFYHIVQFDSADNHKEELMKSKLHGLEVFKQIYEEKLKENEALMKESAK